MGLHFSVLASGSTGNALYVGTEKKSLLVDAGLSGKAMEGLFAQIEKKIEDIEGIFITHEHIDHIRGVGVLARRYKLPIYANEKTWKAMDDMIGTIPTEQKFILPLGSRIQIADIEIESFGISHDAAEPVGYVFYQGSSKLASITDTGYVSDKMKGIIEHADAFVFESNHDVEMLRMGRYPWSVKQRILGDFGHVSNEDAALAMADVIGPKTKSIYLAHLSQDNNMKDLARMAAQQILEQKDIAVGVDVTLYDTDPKVATAIQYI